MYLLIPKSIKVKPIDVNSSTCFDFEVESNDKDPKFKVTDHVRVSKLKNIFTKGYTASYLRKFLLLEKSKILYRGRV